MKNVLKNKKYKTTFLEQNVCSALLQITFDFLCNCACQNQIKHFYTSEWINILLYWTIVNTSLIILRASDKCRTHLIAIFAEMLILDFYFFDLIRKLTWLIWILCKIIHSNMIYAYRVTENLNITSARSWMNNNNYCHWKMVDVFLFLSVFYTSVCLFYTLPLKLCDRCTKWSYVIIIMMATVLDEIVFILLLRHLLSYHIVNINKTTSVLYRWCQDLIENPIKMWHD